MAIISCLLTINDSRPNYWNCFDQVGLGINTDQKNCQQKAYKRMFQLSEFDLSKAIIERKLIITRKINSIRN